MKGSTFLKIHADTAYSSLDISTWASDNTTITYDYNTNWQVLAQYDVTGTEALDNNFIYGNYIDEVVIMTDGTDDHYFAHDHLFSPVALIEANGDVAERYEYDAYGKVTVYTDKGADTIWFTSDDTIQGYSDRSNPYTFTGRRLDVLDGDDLKLMYYRNRTYDTETGRFLQTDMFGINPAGGKNNPLFVPRQYTDGLSLYEYVKSNPMVGMDASGEAIVVGGALVCTVGGGVVVIGGTVITAAEILGVSALVCLAMPSCRALVEELIRSGVGATACAASKVKAKSRQYYRDLERHKANLRKKHPGWPNWKIAAAAALLLAKQIKDYLDNLDECKCDDGCGSGGGGSDLEIEPNW